MYRSFFGLKELPFKISPDLSYFYKQASREEITDALLYSILRGDGIVKVVGEVGIGKTMILRMVAEKLPKNYQKIYISSPNLSPVDFLKFICSELQIPYANADTKHDLVKRLQTHLIEVYAKGQRVVMLVDEAQSMTLDALEEVRLLGNLETETDKLLQIVLFGQPELDVTLADARIKPLRDRIASELSLPPLNQEEVLLYLNYRMRVAGRLDQDVFNAATAKRIWKITGGFPRAINLLADKLLMAAFSQGDQKIKKKHFKAVGHEASWLTSKRLFNGMKYASFSAIFVLLGWQALVLYQANATSANTKVQVQKKTVPVFSPDSMTIAELAKITRTSVPTIKELYRLNMSGFAFLQNQQVDSQVLLLARDSLHNFQSNYGAIMSVLDGPQKAKVFVLLNLKPNKKRFESITVYDVSSLSESALTDLTVKLSKDLPGAKPRLLTVKELKETL